MTVGDTALDISQTFSDTDADDVIMSSAPFLSPAEALQERGSRVV